MPTSDIILRQRLCRRSAAPPACGAALIIYARVGMSYAPRLRGGGVCEGYKDMKKKDLQEAANLIGQAMRKPSNDEAISTIFALSALLLSPRKNVELFPQKRLTYKAMLGKYF